MQEPPSQSRTLRVAVIGYGLAGRVFHAPLIAATPGFSVAAVVTRDAERRAAAAQHFPEAVLLESADDIWQEPGGYDLVVVATPNRTHVPLGLASLYAGIPVVIDKPLATSIEGAERLIEAGETRGVPFTVFQNRRWDGDFLTVRALLDGDVLGKTLRYESRFERFRPEPRPGAWRELEDPEEGGGLLLDLGSHLIDQAVQLFGRPLSVYAEVRCTRPTARVDDDTFVALSFANDVQAHLWMNVVSRSPGPRFFINGLRGSFTKKGLDPQEAALRDGMRPCDPQWGQEPEEAWGRLSSDVAGVHFDGKIETFAGRYEEFYRGVRDALLHGGPMPVQPADALLTLEVIAAARKSAHEGRVVSLAVQPDPGR